MCKMAEQQRANLSNIQDRIVRLIEHIEGRFQLKAKLEELVNMAREHPQIALVVGVTAIVCTLPVFCFAGFVLISAAFALMGFVVLEGFVVSVGAVILLGILAVLAAISITMTGIALIIWLFAKNSNTALHQLWSRMSSSYRHTSHDQDTETIPPSEDSSDKED